MIELIRIIEDQASLSSYRATKDKELALQLELLIETTKPNNPYHEWHPLIATPFRYAPPHPSGRFRPPYGKNIFYGSLVADTSLYEHAYHFMKQRLHLATPTHTGVRTLFSVSANDKQHVRVKDNALLNKNDYAASHDYIIANPKVTFLLYPSCRDPQQRLNAAVLDICLLDKNPHSETTIKFFYDNKHQQMTWIDQDLHIKWDQVS